MSFLFVGLARLSRELAQRRAARESLQSQQMTHDPAPAPADVNRKDYRAWYGLGQTYELLGEPYYALNYYQRATALRPYDARMWSALATCNEKLKRYVTSRILGLAHLRASIAWLVCACTFSAISDVTYTLTHTSQSPGRDPVSPARPARDRSGRRQRHCPPNRQTVRLSRARRPRRRIPPPRTQRGTPLRRRDCRTGSDLPLARKMGDAEREPCGGGQERRSACAWRFGQGGGVLESARGDTGASGRGQDVAEGTRGADALAGVNQTFPFTRIWQRL